MLIDARKPTDAPVPVNKRHLPAGVLVDTGTGKRIPKALWYDDEGNYEYLVLAPDGHNFLVDERNHTMTRRGKAVGKLQLLETAGAAKLGVFKEPPKRIHSPILPMTKDEKVAGLEQYRAIYVKVWSEIRHEDRRSTEDRWANYLRKTSFFDNLVLKRRFVTTS